MKTKTLESVTEALAYVSNNDWRDGIKFKGERNCAPQIKEEGQDSYSIGVKVRFSLTVKSERIDIAVARTFGTCKVEAGGDEEKARQIIINSAGYLFDAQATILKIDVRNGILERLALMGVGSNSDAAKERRFKRWATNAYKIIGGYSGKFYTPITNRPSFLNN